jgi:hypothetical protein
MTHYYRVNRRALTTFEGAARHRGSRAERSQDITAPLPLLSAPELARAPSCFPLSDSAIGPAPQEPFQPSYLCLLQAPMAPHSSMMRWTLDSPNPGFHRDQRRFNTG